MTKKFIAILATLPVATLGVAGLALADGDVIVTNTNYAEVGNMVVAGSNSGGNTANGGNGGDAGNGGSVWGWDNDDNTTGNGGAAGNGGNGGSVTTGDATTIVDILNQVNTNETDVDLCGCEEDENDVEEEDASDDVVVTNLNGAYLGNGVIMGSDSGSNMTDGGAAGNGGNGGNVEGEDNDDNTTGNGGTSGNGGSGGSVTTGNAGAGTVVGNSVNYNTTDIDRCGCGCSGCGDDIVANTNIGLVVNGVGSASNSGDNNTDGGLSGNGGNGGEVADDNNDDNTTGNGGAAGNGGNGGSITTGAASSLTMVTNLINTNTTRIRR